MYALEIKPEVDKIFRKTDPRQLNIIEKKIEYIRKNPFKEYKHLSNPLSGYMRVHIDGSFVLIFRIRTSDETVEVCYYDHHDNIYEWRPSEEE